MLNDLSAARDVIPAGYLLLLADWAQLPLIERLSLYHSRNKPFTPICRSASRWFALQRGLGSGMLSSSVPAGLGASSCVGEAC